MDEHTQGELLPQTEQDVVPEVERELVLPASPEEVWRIVTTSGWLAEDVEFELIPGGEASFSSDGWSKRGWVEDAVRPDAAEGRLVFWWASEGESATRVELTLAPEGDEATRLRVVEARPLDLLDLVGVPLHRAGGSSPGPAMLVAA